MTLSIEQREYEAMRRDCKQAYPTEACGILVGQRAGEERRVMQVVACRNSATDSSHRYIIEPVELIRVQKQARAKGLEIIGFYHSHPDHPALPSPSDLEDAHWIGCSYLITSVVQSKSLETRSFFLSGSKEEDKRFAVEDVLID